MEETLKHEEATQCIGLTPAGPGNHGPNGSKADHALTFKLDHLMGADQYQHPLVGVYANIPVDFRPILLVPVGKVHPKKHIFCFLTHTSRLNVCSNFFFTQVI